MSDGKPVRSPVLGCFFAALVAVGVCAVIVGNLMEYDPEMEARFAAMDELQRMRDAADANPVPFDPARWSAVDGDEKVVMALGLVDSGRLVGESRATVTEWLGPPRWHGPHDSYAIDNPHGWTFTVRYDDADLVEWVACEPDRDW